MVLNIVRMVCVRGTDVVVDDIIQQLSFYLCYQNLLQLVFDSISKRYHLRESVEKYYFDGVDIM